VSRPNDPDTDPFPYGWPDGGDLDIVDSPPPAAYGVATRPATRATLVSELSTVIKRHQDDLSKATICATLVDVADMTAELYGVERRPVTIPVGAVDQRPRMGAVWWPDAADRGVLTPVNIDLAEGIAPGADAAPDRCERYGPDDLPSTPEDAIQPTLEAAVLDRDALVPAADSVPDPRDLAVLDPYRGERDRITGDIWTGAGDGDE